MTFTGPVDHAARAEDVRWMVETGENLTGAAKRLGISTDGVEKWCVLHGMHPELERLRSREPISVGADRSKAGRRNAEVRWAS